MQTRSCSLVLVCGGFALALLTAQAADSTHPPLPRFTEEREAAALHFVKKHLKELLPVLDQLKKGQPAQYEREIREVFQVTEWLADLKDDSVRHDLELNIWVTENRALLLVARLATPDAEERKRLEGQLQELSRELVELDIQVLNTKVSGLKQDLMETEDELSRAVQNRDKRAAERYAELLKKLKRNGK